MLRALSECRKCRPRAMSMAIRCPMPYHPRCRSLSPEGCAARKAYRPCCVRVCEVDEAHASARSCPNLQTAYRLAVQVQRPPQVPALTVLDHKHRFSQHVRATHLHRPVELRSTKGAVWRIATEHVSTAL